MDSQVRHGVKPPVWQGARCRAICSGAPFHAGSAFPHSGGMGAKLEMGAAGGGYTIQVAGGGVVSL